MNMHLDDSNFVIAGNGDLGGCYLKGPALFDDRRLKKNDHIYLSVERICIRDHLLTW